MAKKTSKKYVVVLAICVIFIAALGVVGLLDLRPVAKEVTLPIATDILIK